MAHIAPIIPDHVQEEIAPGEASVGGLFARPFRVLSRALPASVASLQARSRGAVVKVLARLAIIVYVEAGGVARVPF